MPDGEHCECRSYARHDFVKRRIALVLALLTATLVIAIQRDTPEKTPVFVEQIARKSIEQTDGPTGFSAPNNLMPWGLNRIDQRSGTLDNKYEYTNSGAGVTVYVVDSGVKGDFLEEFGARVVDGWSYRADYGGVCDTSSTYVPSNFALCSYKQQLAAYSRDSTKGLRPCVDRADANSTEKNAYHELPPSAFDAPASVDSADKGKTDNDGHGTHVAGIIGGVNVGVAKSVNIVPVRVLDSCGAGTTTMVRKGLEWILADHVAGTKAVVNMSIGFDATASTVDKAIKDLIAKGIVVVAAAGNDSKSACGTTPAGTAGTISVGASGPEQLYNSQIFSGSVDLEGYYSNFGECVDIFAPGTRIASAWPFYQENSNSTKFKNLYAIESGTSMAAPHVTGAVAGYLETAGAVSPSTPAATWAWLKLNATCNAVTYYTPLSDEPSRAGLAVTPNRLLTVGAQAVLPCAPSTIAVVASNGNVTVTWDESVTANGSAITGYVVTVSPGNYSCTPSVMRTFDMSCTISGLSSAIDYSATIKATNGVGASTESIAVSVSGRSLVTPTTTTQAPTTTVAPVVATTVPETTTTTTTTVPVVPVSVTPVKAMKKGTTVPLTRFIATKSNGKKTWTKSGACVIKGTKLVAPRKVATCRLTLRVAKTSKYSAVLKRIIVKVV